MDDHSLRPQAHSCIPEDTVCYAIFRDFSLSNPSASSHSLFLQSLHLKILYFISPYTSSYIWQYEPFSLSLSSSASPPLPDLQGKLRFGDNIEDEWFTVYLLFQISTHFPSLSIQVWDNDGEFLLIEAAFHLPHWINPEASDNRVFIRCSDLHIRSEKPVTQLEVD